jgi:hypothetical protein
LTGCPRLLRRGAPNPLDRKPTADEDNLSGRNSFQFNCFPRLRPEFVCKAEVGPRKSAPRHGRRIPCGTWGSGGFHGIVRRPDFNGVGCIFLLRWCRYWVAGKRPRSTSAGSWRTMINATHARRRHLAGRGGRKIAAALTATALAAACGLLPLPAGHSNGSGVFDESTRAFKWVGSL